MMRENVTTVYRQALEEILSLYHERHLLTPDELARLPFVMKERALVALAHESRNHGEASDG